MNGEVPWARSVGKPVASGLLAGLIGVAGAMAAEPWSPSDEAIESFEASRPGFNVREENVPSYDLPPALAGAESKEAWESENREAVLELFRERMFGRDPGTPEAVEFEIEREDSGAMDGAATLRIVKLTAREGERELSFRMNLFVPNAAEAPAPAFLLICNRDPMENIDPTREVKSPFWPAEMIVARGYAAAAFHNAEVDPDNDDGFRNGAHGLFGDVGGDERPGDAWGTLAAWAWGASRCLDYLASDPGVDGSRVAVIGHSRGGKTALWAAANDPRFEMAVSNESGCGGAALSRRRFGETVARINASFPHWFCRNFHEFGGREDALPIDQHQLIALIAPRPVYVASAAHDLWADPRGEYLALAHAGPAFRLYGLESLPPDPMAPLDTPVRAGRTAYHVRSGGHNLTEQDWAWFLDFADEAL